MTLQIGDKAPAISLQDQNGKLRSSNDLKGKALVLFFYPKDDTPGCTAEACSFQDNYQVFKKLDAEVWGVSGDNIVSHNNFSGRYKLSFPLLSDQDNKLRKAFKVPKALGIIPSRVTFLIDKNGIIRHIFNNLFDGPLHVQEALRAINELKRSI